MLYGLMSCHIKHKRVQKRIALLIGFATAIKLSATFAATFYVANGGNDNNDGLTPDSAWSSLEKVNAIKFQPGDSVLFHRGDQWHESLAITSSGTAIAPIIYGSYGVGNKPVFWGSDVLANNEFSLVAGTSSTYKIAVTKTVNSVLADHVFLRSATLLSGNSSNPTINLNYVNNNANTWYYSNNYLYVNTGGISPATTSKVYTDCVRQNAVLIDHADYIQVQNLVTNETACFNSGYGFSLNFADNVELDNCEAYSAGKHHFAVINSTGFVGNNLRGSFAMPDQGIGGATTYVAYSDSRNNGDTSVWNNCYADQPGGKYPVFYCHGPGLGKVTLNNLVSPDQGISESSENPNFVFTMNGGTVNSVYLASGNGSINAVNINGKNITDSLLVVYGAHNTITNCIISGGNYHPNGEVVVGAANTIFLNNTIVADSQNTLSKPMVHVEVAAGLLEFKGNILSGEGLLAFMSAQNLTLNDVLDYNLFDTAGIIYGSTGLISSLSDWQALGADKHSWSGNPEFVDAGNGNYHLLPGSLAIDGIPIDVTTWGVLSDFYNNNRLGVTVDIGAVAYDTPEPMSLSFMALGFVALLTRKHTQRGFSHTPH